jgi:hypothetical protein
MVGVTGKTHAYLMRRIIMPEVSPFDFGRKIQIEARSLPAVVHPQIAKPGGHLPGGMC